MKLNSFVFIDTAARIMTVAAFNGREFFIENNGEQNRHSEALMPALDAVLKKAGLTIAGADAFCIVTGPGSFTGLRVGLAALKGLLFNTEKPVLALHSGALSAYYEDRRAETLLEILRREISEGVFTSADKAVLEYENKDGGRFKY